MMHITHIVLEFVIFGLLLLSAERFKTHFHISKDSEFYWLSSFTLSASVITGFIIAYSILEATHDVIGYTYFLRNIIIALGAIFVILKIPRIKLNIYIYLLFGVIVSFIGAMFTVKFHFYNELISLPFDMIQGVVFAILAFKVKEDSQFASKYKTLLILFSIVSFVISFSNAINDTLFVASHVIIVYALLHVILYQDSITQKIIDGFIK